MKTTKIILVLLIIPLICYTQVPEIIWQKCYGTSSFDRVYCVEEINNGYLLGLKIDTEESWITNYHGENDPWIINIDYYGNLIWEKCFGGTESESIIKIIKVSDSEFYMVGATESSDYDITCDTNYGSQDFWVLKINENGDILWDHCYGSILGDEMRDAVLTPDGGLLFMGRISSNGGDVKKYYGSMDLWFCKIDSLGNIVWERTMGNQALDNGISMQLISDTSFAFIGGYYEPGGMNDCEIAVTGEGADLWLVEMSLSDGDILNNYCYGGSGNDLWNFFEKVTNGYILSTYSDSYNGDVSGQHGNGDIWVVRIDSQGEIIWQRCLGGSYQEAPSFITQAEDGGFIVIGTAASHNGDVKNNHSWSGGNNSDIWIVKLNNDGEIEWDQCYGGLDDERFFGTHSILKKSDYNYVFNAQAYMNSGDVNCDLNGDIDAWVFEIDTVDTTGAIENHYENDLVRVFPNPAKDYVEFQVQGSIPPTAGQVGSEIRIMSVMGKEVARMPVKAERTVWDCRDAKEGIYFFYLDAHAQKYFGKIILQK